MPSLRKPLSTKQKLIARYTDPDTYALADVVAGDLAGHDIGTSEYRRNFTCFLVDGEARVHKNRQSTARHLAQERDLWDLRRDLCLRVTGRDLLLPQAPSEDAVRKWRNRLIPVPNPNKDDDDRAKDAARASEVMTNFVCEYERLAVQFAQQLGQFPIRSTRNLTKLRANNVCSADGTYVRAYSQVEEVRDPETGKSMFHGARNHAARRDGNRVMHTKVQQHVHRDRKAGRDTMGVNFVAILTRTPFGRVILSVECALGGEVHAALTAMHRMAPLAGGGIYGLTYDKALNGWQIDYLLAWLGIIAISPPTAAKKDAVAITAAKEVADSIIAKRESVSSTAADTLLEGASSGKSKKARTSRADKVIKTAIVRRLLGKEYDIDRLLEDAAAGLALGSGLPLGTSVYLDSHSSVVPVDSVTMPVTTIRHQVGDEECTHELHLDDGALWDTRLESSLVVKDQRVRCVNATVERNSRTRWFELHSTHELVCKHTGEILTKDLHHTPSGIWRANASTTPRRGPLHHLMILARCDKKWRKIYGLRNDTESWFDWLKKQMLDDKRAASLDLNHQLLDVLYAGMLTNSITRFNARRAGHDMGPDRTWVDRLPQMP